MDRILRHPSSKYFILYFYDFSKTIVPNEILQKYAKIALNYGMRTVVGCYCHSIWRLQ
jgi:radical SAM superfamily enzyme